LRLKLLTFARSVYEEKKDKGAIAINIDNQTHYRRKYLFAYRAIGEKISLLSIIFGLGLIFYVQSTSGIGLITGSWCRTGGHSLVSNTQDFLMLYAKHCPLCFVSAGFIAFGLSILLQGVFVMGPVRAYSAT
jgi:hypothetical protein